MVVFFTNSHNMSHYGTVTINCSSCSLSLGASDFVEKHTLLVCPRVVLANARIHTNLRFAEERLLPVRSRKGRGPAPAVNERNNISGERAHNETRIHKCNAEGQNCRRCDKIVVVWPALCVARKWTFPRTPPSDRVAISSLWKPLKPRRVWVEVCEVGAPGGMPPTGAQSSCVALQSSCGCRLDRRRAQAECGQDKIEKDTERRWPHRRRDSQRLTRTRLEDESLPCFCLHVYMERYVYLFCIYLKVVVCQYGFRQLWRWY